MDNKQQAALDSFNRVLVISNNTDYKPILSAIEGYDFEKDILQQSVNTMMNSGVVQTGKDNADETTVGLVKTKMGDTVIKFALRGMVKANQLKNTSLTHALDEPVTYITNASKTEAILRAQTLLNVMNENLKVLTNIKPEDIKAMQDSIDDYNKIKEDPIEDRKIRKAMGTDVIPTAEKDGKQAMDNMYALVRSYLQEENPKLVNLLALATEQTNTAVRHTTVIITVVQEEDTEPIEKADILDEKTGKHFFTDDEGVAELGKHLNGDDTFDISAPGRQTVKVGVKIISRRENEFLVKLKKE